MLPDQNLNLLREIKALRKQITLLESRVEQNSRIQISFANLLKEYDRRAEKRSIMGIESVEVLHSGPTPINTVHGWPVDDQCLFGPWMTKTGLPKPTQYRVCVHSKCKKIQTREAPKA